MGSRDLEDAVIDNRLLREALETTSRHEEIYLSRYRMKLAKDSITVRYPPELAPAVEAFKLIAIKRYGTISRAFVRALGWLIKIDAYGLDIDDVVKQEVADELERLAKKVEAAKKRSELLYCAHKLRFIAGQIRGLAKPEGGGSEEEKVIQKQRPPAAERPKTPLKEAVASPAPPRKTRHDKPSAAPRKGDTELPSYIADNPWVNILSKRK